MMPHELVATVDGWGGYRGVEPGREIKTTYWGKTRRHNENLRRMYD